MSESTMPGGWTPLSCDISPKSMEVFQAVTKGLVGVNYELVACATQIVNGTNYSFFCNSKKVIPNAPIRSLSLMPTFL